MTTTRKIVLNIDTPVGNRLYWFLKELMSRYPIEIQEEEQ